MNVCVNVHTHAFTCFCIVYGLHQAFNTQKLNFIKESHEITVNNYDLLPNEKKRYTRILHFKNNLDIHPMEYHSAIKK